MNVRVGFARLARVTAIAYLLVAIAVVGSDALHAYQFHPNRVRTYQARLEAANLIVTVRANNEAEARETWRRRCSNVAGGGCTGAKTSAWDRDGTPIVELEMSPTARLKGVWEATRPDLFGWLLAYVILWAVFRAIRWIALGFMDGRGAKPPSP